MAAIVDCKIVENPFMLENLEWSISLLRVFNLQNSGIPRNSEKILTGGGVYYYVVLLYFLVRYKGFIQIPIEGSWKIVFKLHRQCKNWKKSCEISHCARRKK